MLQNPHHTSHSRACSCRHAGCRHAPHALHVVHRSAACGVRTRSAIDASLRATTASRSATSERSAFRYRGRPTLSPTASCGSWTSAAANESREYRHKGNACVCLQHDHAEFALCIFTGRCMHGTTYRAERASLTACARIKSTVMSLSMLL